MKGEEGGNIHGLGVDTAADGSPRRLTESDRRCSGKEEAVGVVACSGGRLTELSLALAGGQPREGKEAMCAAGAWGVRGWSGAVVEERRRCQGAGSARAHGLSWVCCGRDMRGLECWRRMRQQGVHTGGAP